MQPFRKHTGVVVPLDRVNVDTDQIIPKQFLKRIERTGFGEFLFYDWRFSGDGKERGKKTGDFVLDAPRYAKASILVAGKNFGCGSSREHAVWALAQYGFRAIIAPSFADIFASNCYRNGVLPVQLPAASVDDLVRGTEAGLREIEVDLERQVITNDLGFEARFTADPYGRELLLRGLDEIGRTLLEEPSIAAFERRHG